MSTDWLVFWSIVVPFVGRFTKVFVFIWFTVCFSVGLSLFIWDITTLFNRSCGINSDTCNPGWLCGFVLNVAAYCEDISLLLASFLFSWCCNLIVSNSLGLITVLRTSVVIFDGRMPATSIIGTFSENVYLFKVSLNDTSL